MYNRWKRNNLKWRILFWSNPVGGVRWNVCSACQVVVVGPVGCLEHGQQQRERERERERGKLIMSTVMNYDAT
jgi:hypothetical protein